MRRLPSLGWVLNSELAFQDSISQQTLLFSWGGYFLQKQSKDSRGVNLTIALVPVTQSKSNISTHLWENVSLSALRY